MDIEILSITAGERAVLVYGAAHNMSGRCSIQERLMASRHEILWARITHEREWMMQSATPVRAGNDAEISHAMDAQWHGENVTLPEPDYSGVPFDIEEAEFRQRLAGMKPMIYEQFAGFDWDYSAVFGSAITSGFHDVPRWTTRIRLADGTVVGATARLASSDTAIVYPDELVYIPALFRPKFRRQLAEFYRLLNP